jgi:hypothetical protein
MAQIVLIKNLKNTSKKKMDRKSESKLKNLTPELSNERKKFKNIKTWEV